MDDFWLRSAKYVTQPKLSDETLLGIEDYLGVRLPKAYLDLLRRLNGGVTRRNAHWFAMRDPCCQTHSRFEAMLGIPPAADLEKPHRTQARTLASAREFTEAWELPSLLIPFTEHLATFEADCLDYRSCGPTGNPSVAFVTTQQGGKYGTGEVLGIPSNYLLSLAPDFESFVNGLFVGCRDHCYGIAAPSASFETVRDWLAAAIYRATGDAPSKERYFLIDYAAGNTDESHETAWLIRNWRDYNDAVTSSAIIILSPNRELGGNYNFLEHPECEWLVFAKITPKYRRKLERILDELPCRVVPLHIPDLKRLL